MGASSRPDSARGKGSLLAQAPGTASRDPQEGMRGGAGWGRLTWHLVHRREHRTLHRGVAAAPAALVVETERQVLGGRGGAKSKPQDFGRRLDREVQEGYVQTTPWFMLIARAGGEGDGALDGVGRSWSGGGSAGRITWMVPSGELAALSWGERRDPRGHA